MMQKFGYTIIFVALLSLGFGCLKADFEDESEKGLKETITIKVTALLAEGKEWPLEYRAFFSALNSFGVVQTPTKEIILDSNKKADAEIEVVPADVVKVKLEIFNSDQTKIFEGEKDVALASGENEIEITLHEATNADTECSGITILKATPSNTQPTYGEKVTFSVDIENTSSKYDTLYFKIDKDKGMLTSASGEIDSDSFSFEWTTPSESGDKVGEAQIDISIGYNESITCTTLTKKIGYGETKYIGAKLYIDFINMCEEIGDEKSRYTGTDETDFDHEVFIAAPKCADKGVNFDDDATYGYTQVSVSDDRELTVTEFTVHSFMKFGSDFEKEGNSVLQQVIFSKGNIFLWSYPKVSGDKITKFVLQLDLYEPAESADSEPTKFPSEEEKLETAEITRDDNFHLVTVSVANYDKRANIRFYYDGELIKQYSFNQELKIGDSLQDLVIGYAQSEYPINFYGIIETFALYNYEKTEEEIKEEYQEFTSN